MAVSLGLLTRGQAWALRAPYIVAAAPGSMTVCWETAPQAESCQDFKNLSPGKEFNYSLPGLGATWTAKALPGPSQEFSFAAFGDSGTASRAQKKIAAIIKVFDPELVLHLGDIIYPKGDPRDYDPKYFDIYGETLSRIPFFPAIGNHDYGFRNGALAQQRFEEVYNRIFRRLKYYSFDAGDAHFVSLDTNKAFGNEAAAPFGPGSEQRAWLEKDLAKSKAKWKIVFMHVPAYSTVRGLGNSDSVRDALAPIFERYRVDLVLAGHVHVYERSRPINGVVYVNAGTGGAELTYSDEHAEWQEKLILRYGLALVKVKASALELSFIDEDGRIRDSVLISRERTAALKRSRESAVKVQKIMERLRNIFLPPLKPPRY